MKHLKKLLAAALATFMALVIATPALAAQIDVTSVINGEEYTAYKILNYTDNGKTGNERAASYYLTSAEYTQIGSVLEAAGFKFTPSADGSQYVVNNAKTIDVAGAAEYLGAHVADLGDALGKATATGANGSASFTDLGKGYYFVTTTAGSLCALHEDTAIATAVEKNTVTTPDKKQGLEDGTYADTQLDVNIGDTVYYDAEIKIGKGANYAITATDTLSTGLTLNHAEGQITVEVNGVAVPAANYTLNATDSGFEIVFTADYIKTLAENTVIKIEYSAVVNKDAAIATAIPNTFKIDYSKQHFEDHTDVKTYDVNLKKTDGTTALAGAKFNVFTSETGGTALTFSKDNKGYYLDAKGTAEIDAGDGTGVNIRGLEPGTYWFEETEAPAGFNKLDKRVSVTVTKDQTDTAEITVINESGSVLPSTGGMGTTLFYVVGGLMVAGAAIALIAKNRVAKMEA